ncbi:MAG: restriction endonuclease subunit S [Candidatus Omnitrophota bacterium]|nr:restriction endonuclease subunit S [Candidatus Omnitrophota bacterium]
MRTNWQTKKLEEVCEVFADGDWIEKKDQSTSGIRLIQTGNIGNGYFLDRSGKARYISEDTFKRLRCTEVLPGDCLLSRLPDPVGRASLIPDTGQKMITAVDCTIMRFKKDILPKWFIYYSLCPDYQNKINKEVSGATRQRISRSNLGNIEIPIPPLQQQKHIVTKLDDFFSATAKVKENAEKKLVDLEELKKSILQKAFTGKLAGACS